MGFIVTLYVVLLLIFLVISGIILRHALKFGYLAPSFRWLSAIFAIVSIVLIVLSIYFLIQAGNGGSSSNFSPPPSAPSSNGNFNF